MPPEPRLIDARGLKCPLPVLRLEKALETVAPGQAIRVLADDPVARIDIPLLCRQQGHDCRVEEEDGALAFTVTRKA